MELIVTDGLTLLGIAILAYMISYVSIPVIRRVAILRQLYDRPGERKLHTEVIPTLGGIAIFLAFLFSFSVSTWSDNFPGFSYLNAALLLLLFTGLKDDLVTISPLKKLVAQLVAVGLVVFGSGIEITNFYGVLGIGELPALVSIPLTFFTIIVVINAANLIDGIDGLAGGVGAIASLFFGAGFLLAGQFVMAVFSVALAGALLGFLRYNFSPASIFMGDTGSMLLGFLLSIQAIQFINLSAVPEFYNFFGNSAPVLVVAILGLPLYDTLRVTITRTKNGRSIFKPGQDHVHHELLRIGFNHGISTTVLYAGSITLVVMSAMLASLNVNLLLGIVIASCLFLFPTNGVKRRIAASLFNIDWEAYRNYKLGIEPVVNGNVNGNGHAKHYEHELEEAGTYQNSRANGNGNGNNGHSQDEESDFEKARKRIKDREYYV